MGVPAESKALAAVSMELYLGVDLALRLARVLRAIKDEDLAINAHGGQDIRVLGLVPSLVDFAGVVNLLSDVELDLGSVASLAVAAHLAALIVVVLGAWLSLLGNLHLGDLDVVRLLVRGMGSDEETVDPDVLVLRLFHVREPLGGERGPLQGIATGRQEEGLIVCRRLVR